MAVIWQSSDSISPRQMAHVFSNAVSSPSLVVSRMRRILRPLWSSVPHKLNLCLVLTLVSWLSCSCWSYVHPSKLCHVCGAALSLSLLSSLPLFANGVEEHTHTHTHTRTQIHTHAHTLTFFHFMQASNKLFFFLYLNKTTYFSLRFLPSSVF